MLLKAWRSSSIRQGAPLNLQFCTNFAAVHVVSPVEGGSMRARLVLLWLHEVQDMMRVDVVYWPAGPDG